MAGPGGREAGRVTVKVVPDTDGFPEKVRRELQQIDDVEIPVRLNTALAKADFAALKQQLERQDVNVGVDIDRNQLGTVADAVTGIGKAATGSVAEVSNLKTTLSNVATSAIGLITQSATLGFTLTAVGAAAMLAAGAITAGIGTLPAVLTAAAAPIAAVALGMDGIKNAAKTLKPEFDGLRASVSATFEHGLLPAFEALRGVFPTLQTGLSGIATSLSGMATSLAQTVSSTEGIQNLRAAFDGVRLAIDTAAPGFAQLTASILRVAGMESIYRSLGDIINGFASGFASFLDQIRQSGALADGMLSLHHVFNGIGDAIKAIALAALDFFNGAAPGLSNFFTALGDTVSRIDWAALGTSLGDVFTKLADGLNSIPQERLDYLKTMFTDLGNVIQAFVDAGGLQLLIFLFGALVGAATVLLAPLVGLMATLNYLGEVVSSLADRWSRGWSNMMAAVGRFAGQVGSALASLWANIVSGVTGFLATVGSAMSNGWNRAREIVSSAWNAIANAVSSGVGRAVSFVASLPGRIAGAVGNLGSLLWNAGQSLIQGFIGGIRSMIGSAIAAARSAVTAVRNFFPFSPAKEGPFSGRGYTTYSGRALVNDWADGIRSGTGTAVSAVENMMRATNATANAEWRGQITSDGLGGGLSEAVFSGVVSAFSGSHLRVDGNGVAQLVNTTNKQQAIRRING